MKKFLLSFALLSLLFFFFSGVTYGWQGRMAGMENPYGLISDESDFLIHTAKIAKGEGIKFYGDYSLTYTDTTDWSYNLNFFTTAGVLTGFYQYDTSGEEYKHNALLGAAFPVGVGRMGVFFTYDDIRGNYSGNENVLGTSNFANYELSNDLKNFALKLLYGIPVGSFKLGGEAQIARREEEHNNFMLGYENYTLGTGFPNRNLTPFQLPYDSSYWEALLKGSLEGKAGPLDFDFTLRGGYIFSGDNSWSLTQTTVLIDFGGDVKGWRIGGDLWARYPLADGFTLPFLVKVDYQEKTREGTGIRYDGSIYHYPYESSEQNINFEAGGGVDKELGKGARVSAGLYYNYLQGKYDFYLRETTNGIDGQLWDHSDYPYSTEHKIMVRLAGELEVSPAVTLRMGLAPFYGLVKEDFTFSPGVIPTYTDDISLDGYHWGIGASLGGTIKLKPITLEPFLNLNYSQLKLDGDGPRVDAAGTVLNLWEMDKARSEWSIGAGLSILFGQ